MSKDKIKKCLQSKKLSYDVVVVGGGTAGVIAAIAAGRMGMETLVVERSGMVGGELITGLQIDGAKNARGDWLIGGIPLEIFRHCEEIDEYTKCIFDWRLIYGYMVDPELLKLVIVDYLKKANVNLLLNTAVYDVLIEDNNLTGVLATSGNEFFEIESGVVIDCTGDGEVAVKADVPYEDPSAQNEIQPISSIFRMNNIDINRLLKFIRDNPKEIICAESPLIDKTPEECTHEIYKQGYPCSGLSANGSLLGKAIEDGEMYETMAVYWMPVALKRNEIALNTTRIPNVDATKSEIFSLQLPNLFSQIRQCADFLKNKVPGFEEANICAISHKIGVRETRRIMGEYKLTKDDVLNRRKFDDVIAKGGHHIDIHGSGTSQIRKSIPEGGSYDIPYRCLLPQNCENLIVAGRSFSSDRAAHSSARVMATCMTMGQAAGVAASLALKNNITPKELSYQKLGPELEKQGAVLTGVK